MDEKTQKTLENAVAICAEHAKNTATNASTALKERQAVDASKAALDKKIADTEANLAEKLSEAQDSVEATLQQMTAQAQRAEDAVEATETAQKAVAHYVDVTFPSAIEQAQKTLENATTSGVNALTERANQAVVALDKKQTAIVETIDTKASEVNTALDTKLATANTAINEAVERAETAKGDAVKAKEQASKSAEQASTSASNAATSAEQAESAKTAIGDVGGRLNALETSVERKAPKISNYLRGMFDYTLVETKYPYWILFASCHDGWMFNENYWAKPRFHVSSTGKVTQIMTGHSSVTSRLLIADTNNNSTRFYETLSGKHYLTTISGVGDSVAISRVEITAFPTEAIGTYTNVCGIVLKNGFIVCTNGHILDSNLDYFGGINCSATVRAFTQLLRVGDNAVRYFDTSTKKQTKLTIADDGTLSFEECYYTYPAQSNELYYMFDSRNKQLALLINTYAVKVSNGDNGNFYKYGNEWLPLVWAGSSRFGFICNGQDLFYVNGSANGVTHSVTQHTFNLVDTFERRELTASLYEDATGNFIIVEARGTVYVENTGYLHVFKYREA